MCGKESGDIELTDGVFVWLSGLAHYVADHGVRLPRRFVRHAVATIDALETPPRDEQWWRDVHPDLSAEIEPDDPSTLGVGRGE